MNRQELERLIASLTEDELQQLRDYRLDDAEPSFDERDANPAHVETRRFVKELLGGSDD